MKSVKTQAQKDFEILQMYNDGNSVQNTRIKIGCAYAYVSAMFNDWDLEKSRRKEEIENAKIVMREMNINFDRETSSNFVLLTDNKKLKTLAEKLNNPKLK